MGKMPGGHMTKANKNNPFLSLKNFIYDGLCLATNCRIFFLISLVNITYNQLKMHYLKENMENFKERYFLLN